MGGAAAGPSLSFSTSSSLLWVHPQNPKSAPRPQPGWDSCRVPGREQRGRGDHPKTPPVLQAGPDPCSVQFQLLQPEFACSYKYLGARQSPREGSASIFRFLQHKAILHGAWAGGSPSRNRGEERTGAEGSDGAFPCGSGAGSSPCSRCPIPGLQSGPFFPLKPQQKRGGKGASNIHGPRQSARKCLALFKIAAAIRGEEKNKKPNSTSAAPCALSQRFPEFPVLSRGHGSGVGLPKPLWGDGTSSDPPQTRSETRPGGSANTSQPRFCPGLKGQ